MKFNNLTVVRRHVPGPIAPSRAQLTTISNGLAEAADYAEQDGRPHTAKSYRIIRDELREALDNDLLELEWRGEHE